MKLPTFMRRCLFVATALGCAFPSALAQDVGAGESPDATVGVVSAASFLTPSVNPDALKLEWNSVREGGPLVALKDLPQDSHGEHLQDVRSSVFQPRGWLVGVEATYLQATTSKGNTPLFPESDFGFAGAPRIWVEYVANNCWGVRGAFWTYGVDWQTSSNGSTTIPVPTVSSVLLTDNLDMYAVDLELTRRIYLERSDLWLTLGVRNGRLHRGMSSSGTIVLPTFGQVTSLVTEMDRNFNGTGLTSSVGWRRPIGERNIALFLNFRNSVLWGGNAFAATTTELSSTANGSQLDPTTLNTTSLALSDSSAMWVGELQAGAEWARDLSGGMNGISAFTRVMLEGQWWATPELDTAGIGAETYNLVGVTASVGFMR